MADEKENQQTSNTEIIIKIIFLIAFIALFIDSLISEKMHEVIVIKAGNRADGQV